ncbi:hypothetical protein CLU79DRAFT_741561 [Phycomyces nitens]|nr:hypothetical protein CLU79DRAFT_741561 [Phycomyces nitens]
MQLASQHFLFFIVFFARVILGSEIPLEKYNETLSHNHHNHTLHHTKSSTSIHSTITSASASATRIGNSVSQIWCNTKTYNATSYRHHTIYSVYPTTTVKCTPTVVWIPGKTASTHRSTSTTIRSQVTHRHTRHPSRPTTRKHTRPKPTSRSTHRDSGHKTLRPGHKSSSTRSSVRHSLSTTKKHSSAHHTTHSVTHKHTAHTTTLKHTTTPSPASSSPSPSPSIVLSPNTSSTSSVNGGSAGQSTDIQPTEDQPTEDQPTPDQPTSEQPTEDQPTDNNNGESSTDSNDNNSDDDNSDDDNSDESGSSDDNGPNTTAANPSVPDPNANNSNAISESNPVNGSVSNKSLGLGLGLGIGGIAAVGLAGLLVHNRRKNESRSNSTIIDDPNARTRWRTQSFMGAVAAAVSRLPRSPSTRSNSSGASRVQSGQAFGTGRGAVEHDGRYLSGESTGSPPSLTRIEGEGVPQNPRGMQSIDLRY